MTDTTDALALLRENISKNMPLAEDFSKRAKSSPTAFGSHHFTELDLTTINKMFETLKDFPDGLATLTLMTMFIYDITPPR